MADEWSDTTSARRGFATTALWWMGEQLANQEASTIPPEEPLSRCRESGKAEDAKKAIRGVRFMSAKRPGLGLPRRVDRLTHGRDTEAMALSRQSVQGIRAGPSSF